MTTSKPTPAAPSEIAQSAGGSTSPPVVNMEGEAFEGPVLNRILASFVGSVEAQPGLEEVGSRLKQLLDASDFTEAGLKRALFGEDAP